MEELSAYFITHLLHLWSDYFTLPNTPWWVPRSTVERPSIMHRDRTGPDRFLSGGVPQDLLAACEIGPWIKLKGTVARSLREDLFAMVHKDVGSHHPLRVVPTINFILH